MRENNRFEIIIDEYSSFGSEQVRIMRDKETGVHYLFHKFLDAGGLTVLLDKDGKPVISPKG